MSQCAEAVGKARGSAWATAWLWMRGGRAGRRGRVSGGDGAEAVVVELEEIVGGGDEPAFRPAGRSAAALEASDLAVELQLAEDGLDGGLSGPVSGAPDGRAEHAAHEVIEAAGPSRSRRRP